MQTWSVEQASFRGCSLCRPNNTAYLLSGTTGGVLPYSRANARQSGLHWRSQPRRQCPTDWRRKFAVDFGLEGRFFRRGKHLPGISGVSLCWRHVYGFRSRLISVRSGSCDSTPWCRACRLLANTVVAIEDAGLLAAALRARTETVSARAELHTRAARFSVAIGGNRLAASTTASGNSSHFYDAHGTRRARLTWTRDGAQRAAVRGVGRRGACVRARRAQRCSRFATILLVLVAIGEARRTTAAIDPHTCRSGIKLCPAVRSCTSARVGTARASHRIFGERRRGRAVRAAGRSLRGAIRCPAARARAAPNLRVGAATGIARVRGEVVGSAW